MRKIFAAAVFAGCLCAFAAQKHNNGKTFISAGDVDRFMKNYYHSPAPQLMPEFLEFIPKNYENSILSPLCGFCYEIFRANPEKLESWSATVAKLRPRELRDAIIGLYPAAAGENGEKLRRECYVKYRSTMGPEPRMAVPTAGQLKQLAAADPDFAWGAFCASGKLEYPEAVLRYTLSPAREKNIDVMKYAARWSLWSFAQEDERVAELIRNYFKTAAPEEKQRFFKNIPDEVMRKIYPVKISQ